MAEIIAAIAQNTVAYDKWCCIRILCPCALGPPMIIIHFMFLMFSTTLASLITRTQYHRRRQHNIELYKNTFIIPFTPPDYAVALM